MSHDEVEGLLGIGGNTTEYCEDLEMRLQIERGALDPMENFEPSYDSPRIPDSKRDYDNSDKITIVLDPNKGIYSLDDANAKSTQKNPHHNVKFN